MYNIDTKSYNSIILHTDSKSKKKKIMCVICYPTIELSLVNEEEGKWKCPRCKNDYFILGYDRDLVPEEDELISSHEQNNEGPLLLSATDTDIDSTSKLDRENQSKTDKKLPKYLQDSDTTKLISYEER